MAGTNGLVKQVEEMALQSRRQAIVGRNALAKQLFAHLRSRLEAPCALLLLCTVQGLVLDYYAEGAAEALSGHTLSFEALYQKHGGELVHSELTAYRIIAPARPGMAPLVDRLGSELNALLGIIDASEGQSRSLLACLDSVRNAISIYDKDARLLFANTQFCKYFRIDDRDAVLGMDIRDITDRSGLKVHSMESDSGSLKMLDVLKSGKEALDWEVRIEAKDKPEDARLASNDMYPVIGENGEVQGLVELARSHQQDMKRTRKILGLAAEYNFADIIGSSPAIREKIRLAKDYANNSFNFLLTGESGVGKELFAQSIHNNSPNRKGPFVALNCASIPENLIESELFGYVAGAFTGASKNGQVGKFELADTGTLFLDEIGELPYHFQSKLLRVLETWTVTRIGSSKEIPINVRLVAATNRNLDEMVAEGLFRQDLYYRLQVLNIEIPPLRERGEDILLLGEHFLKQFVDPDTGRSKTLGADTKRAMLEYDWPGNVRELRNVINRIVILSKAEVVTPDILEASLTSKGFMLKKASSETPEDRLAKRRSEVDASYANLLNEVLEISGGNRKQAAELLGVSRKTFYRMMDKYL